MQGVVKYMKLGFLLKIGVFHSVKGVKPRIKNRREMFVLPLHVDKQAITEFLFH